MEESTTYQAILAEGEKRLLLLMGTKRFGPTGCAHPRSNREARDSPRVSERDIRAAARGRELGGTADRVLMRLLKR